MEENIIQLIKFKRQNNSFINKFIFKQNENFIQISTQLDFSKDFQIIKNAKNENEKITSKIQYFEIKIKGEYPNISIGMISNKNETNKSIHIGKQNNSIGYYSNDGKIYMNNKIKSYFNFYLMKMILLDVDIFLIIIKFSLQKMEI